MLLASECMDEAASVYLNDSQKLRWPYAVLLPYLRSAVGEMQSVFEENDLPTLHEQSAVLTVIAGILQLQTPDDMVLPLRMYERGIGETRFNPMDENSWEPDELASEHSSLDVWVYREGLIQLRGANQDRQVKLQYIRSLSTVASETSLIEVPNAKGFLSARTAGLAATFGGRATERGDAANARANGFLKAIVSFLIKRTQNRPVRRRRYQWRRQQ